jgi:hypothetical protein
MGYQNRGVGTTACEKAACGRSSGLRAAAGAPGGTDQVLPGMRTLLALTPAAPAAAAPSPVPAVSARISDGKAPPCFTWNIQPVPAGRLPSAGRCRAGMLILVAPEHGPPGPAEGKIGAVEG